MANRMFARTDQRLLARWWWTVDRWMLAAVGLLIVIGTLLIAAASPPVAERINLGTYYFVHRHILMLIPTVGMMIGMSLLPPSMVRKVAIGVLILSVLLTVLTLFIGMEIKGARRWIHLPGFSLQPSEFIKPSFAIVAAWLFSQAKIKFDFPGIRWSMAIYALIATVLILQPDLGMTVLVTAAWFAQFFFAGLPLILVGLMAGGAILGLGTAYIFLPHVQSRIDRFLDPSSGDTYNIERSLESFMNGGLFGTGPGQGTVKMTLPEAHADFIFAVAGEEMGLIFCLFLVGLYVFIVLRGLSKALSLGQLFPVIAVGGLLTQFGLQTLINMGSSLHMIPTKGMTMPFVSYGGSSLLATGFGIGAVLALTRRRSNDHEE